MKRWQVIVVASLIIVGLFLLDGGQVYVKQAMNRPPKAAFSYRTPTRTLKYIAPTDRDTIMFLNNSTDLDGDPITSAWYIRYNGTGEWRLLNSSRDHWGKLPVSNENGHEIRLVVSDGLREASNSTILTVDSASLSNYTSRRIGIQLKGIAYHIGRYFMGDYGRPPADDEIQETLTVIKYELGSNAIQLWGGYEDVMLKSAKAAINMGFKEIFLIPRYQRVAPNQAITISEHTKRVIEFAKSVEEVRQLSEAVVYCVSNELSVDVMGISNSTDYFQRVKDVRTQLGTSAYNMKLNSYLKEIASGVRSNFKGRITYSAIGYSEAGGVDWNGLGFDIVSSQRYFSRQGYQPASYRAGIDTLRQYGKPVRITEFGSLTYAGASLYGGSGFENYKDQKYDQEEQATNIIQTMELFDPNTVGGVYLFECFERLTNDATSYGLLKFNGNANLRTRKLGFYAYASYVLANSLPSIRMGAQSNAPLVSSTSSTQIERLIAMPVLQMQYNRPNQFRG